MKNSDQTEIRTLLATIGIANSFKEGSVMQFQEEQVHDVFYVDQGIAVACYYEQNGKETWLDSFSRGEMIGLENLPGGGRAQSQIIARTDIIVLQIKHRIFQEMMVRHPALNQFVLQRLVGRLRRYQECRMEAHMLSKRGRVASEIRRMAEPTNTASPEYIVSPKPVISEMALRLGIARETVSRTVSDLIKNQVIERGSSGFIVPDLGRLEAQMR